MAKRHAPEPPIRYTHEGLTYRGSSYVERGTVTVGWDGHARTTEIGVRAEMTARPLFRELVHAKVEGHLPDAS